MKAGLMGIVTSVVHAAGPVLPDPVIPPDVLLELDQSRDWLLGSWWTPGIAAVASIAFIAWAVRRRHHRQKAVYLTVAAGLSFIMFLVLGVNVWASYIPSVATAKMRFTGQAPQRAGGGNVMSIKIPAPPEMRVRLADTWIYLPPGYNPQAAARYPVVYLIHGSPGMSQDWLAGGGGPVVMDTLLAHQLIRPMILVAPPMSPDSPTQDTECLNSTNGGPQMEDYLLKVVVPYIDANYRTQASRDYRAIGGMSMGGYCAIDQGVRHTDKFGVILASQPYDNPGDGGRNYLATQEDFDRVSPGKYLPTVDLPYPLHVFVNVGARNSPRGKAEPKKLVAMLQKRGQDVYYREEPAHFHNWGTSRAGLPYMLVFAHSRMPK